MGYRATSSWSGGASPSSRQNPQDVGTDGLTDKQRDMSNARNPMNNNEPNVSTSKGDAGLEKKALKKTPSQGDPQKAALAQASVQEMRKKLGSTAYEVQGLVNKFLKQGKAQAGVSSSYDIAFEGNKFAVKNGMPNELDLTAAAQEKMGQLRDIKEASKDFFTQDPTGKWVKRSTDDAIKQVTDYDQLDEATRGRVDEMIGLVKLINEYENRGYGKSAEAMGLREQLASIDENGLVSGMYKAIEDYEKFASDKPESKWFGDEGDEGLTLEEILSYDEKAIQDELKSAVSLGKGIFSGAYESGLKRQVDTESAEAQQAANQEAEYRNDLLSASKDYMMDFQKKFMTQADQIKNAFQTAAPQIIEKMQADNTPSGRAALSFFTELQKTDANDFATVISRLLYDPKLGLQREQREKISEYLGSVIPGVEGQGKLAGWITELGQQGYIEENGKRVDLNAEEKYQMLSALRSGNPEKAKQVVDGAMIRADIDLDKALEDVSVSGNLEKVMAGFTDAIAKSLNTLAGSRTEDAVRRALQITDKQWAAMDQAQKSALIDQQLKLNPKLLMESVDAAANDYKKQTEQVVTAKKESLTKATEEIYKKMDEIKAAQPKIEGKYRELDNRVHEYFTKYANLAATNYWPKYMTMFENNAQYYTDVLGKSKMEMATASNALAMRDSLIQLSRDNPTMFKLAKSGNIEKYIGLGSKDAVAAAISNDSMFKDLQAFFTSTFNNRATLDRIINGYPGLKQQKLLLDKMRQQSNTSLSKAASMLGTISKQTKDLESISKSLASRIFSPEEIGRLAQEVGHSIEGSAMELQGLGDITGEDINAGFVDMGDVNLSNIGTELAESTAAAAAPGSLVTRFGEDVANIVGPNEPLGREAMSVKPEEFNSWVNENKKEIDKIGNDVLKDLMQRKDKSNATGEPIFKDAAEMGAWLKGIIASSAEYAGKGIYVVGTILKIVGATTGNPVLAGIGEVAMLGGAGIELGSGTYNAYIKAEEDKDAKAMADAEKQVLENIRRGQQSQRTEAVRANEGTPAARATMIADNNTRPRVQDDQDIVNQIITNKTGYALPVTPK